MKCIWFDVDHGGHRDMIHRSGEEQNTSDMNSHGHWAPIYNGLAWKNEMNFNKLKSINSIFISYCIWLKGINYFSPRREILHNYL